MLYKDQQLFLVIRADSPNEGAIVKEDEKSDLNIFLTVSGKTYEVSNFISFVCEELNFIFAPKCHCKFIFHDTTYNIV